MGDRYAKEAEKFHAIRQAYLKKVEHGRSIRRMDPLQPAFSEQAEDLRQAKPMGLMEEVADRQRANAAYRQSVREQMQEKDYTPTPGSDGDPYGAL